MTDQMLNTLLEVVKELLDVVVIETGISPESEEVLRELGQKLDALIAQRKGGD